MSILNTFRSLKRMQTKRIGGVDDSECNICFEKTEKFEKLNCKNCSDQNSNICKICANIIKTQKKNCPMCRGNIAHHITNLRDRVEARKKVYEMQPPASSSRRNSPNTMIINRTRKNRD
jgi:hypothetical protein